jgi:hypothetical protein
MTDKFVRMRKRYWIRPVYCAGRLASIALCRTPRPPLTDSDIISHFAPDEGGTYARMWAEELSPGCKVVWGGPIDVE